MVQKQHLENERLLIEVNADGAELSRILDKKSGKEILWNADPEIWNRHAPILFPMVGSCYEGIYRYKEKKYPMGQHGFARDFRFEVTSAKGNEIWYCLTDSEESREKYPFAFQLEVGYRLEEEKIHVMWRVVNPDNHETLYFTIGGHPAFVTPEGCGGFMKISAPEKRSLNYERFSAKGFVNSGSEDTLVFPEEGVLIDEHFYDVPTYVFHKNQVETLTLCLPDNTPYVSLHCKGFPYLALWSPDIHKFNCIEPWFGRCDNDGFHGDIKDKTGMISLEPGEEFKAEYTIEIHELREE